jgi:hypothetical protein
VRIAELQRQLLTALRAVMTIDAASFATADPETLLFTGAHGEDLLSRLNRLGAAVRLDSGGGAGIGQVASSRSAAAVSTVPFRLPRRRTGRRWS